MEPRLNVWLSVRFSDSRRCPTSPVSRRYRISATGSGNSRSTTRLCDSSRDDASQQYPQDR